MKGMKKLLSILVVLTLVMSLGASALALDITMDEKNDDGVGKYSAYRLFNLTTTAEARPDGSGFSYTVNPTYRDIMVKAAGIDATDKTEKQLDAELLEELGKFTTDSTEIRTFADAVYKAIIDPDSGIDADYTSTDGKFTGVDQGYYLIAEEGAAGGAVSQVMLDTAGRENITVTTKEEVPSSEKFVTEKNDTTGSETAEKKVADYDIGDDVPFQLTATIPAGTTNRYNEAYKLTFHDKLSAGLSFKKDSLVVKVNGTKVEDTTKYSVVTDGLTDGCTFEVVIANVKGITGFTPANENKITVEYTATLGEGATIGGKGNPNTMHIEYSNDPYSTGTGNTPDNTVTVFTFELDVNKVKAKAGDPSATEPLEGAVFTLQKFVDGAWKDIETVGYTEGTETPDGKTTKFTFEGLDEGTYKIVETVVPDGYNKADDIEFTITATYDGSTLKSVSAKVTQGADENSITQGDVGKLNTQVLNSTGVELPETGGIGTTIFYVAGAILVVGALVLLVTRRRVNGAEK